MKAIHVNWTQPFFQKHRLRGHGFKIQKELSNEYNQPDYQILYTILSILYWKKYNGPIKLYTDNIGLNFYQQYNIDKLYNDINIEILNNYTHIDPAYFWTSGKIHCLQFENEPFTFIDQDFIVREKLPEYTQNADLTIGHWEIPRGYYYFTKKQFKNEIIHYELPKDYNVNAWIPNTSFMCVNNLELIKEYVSEHSKMIDTTDDVPEWFWLLTDQGVLGYCFRSGKYKIDTLTDKVFLSDSDYGKLPTRNKGLSEAWYYPIPSDIKKDEFPWEHVWLSKVVYGLNPNKMIEDCKRFYNEIYTEFSEYRWILNQERLKQYANS
jgi:hypothetical protein